MKVVESWSPRLFCSVAEEEVLSCSIRISADGDVLVTATWMSTIVLFHRGG